MRKNNFNLSLFSNCEQELCFKKFKEIYKYISSFFFLSYLFFLLYLPLLIYSQQMRFIEVKKMIIFVGKLQNDKLIIFTYYS